MTVRKASKKDLAKILAFGIHRVVIDKTGSAVSPSRALKENKILPEVVFVMKDGFAIGAPKKYEQVAHELWADDYIAFLSVRPISEYRPLRKKNRQLLTRNHSK